MPITNKTTQQLASLIITVSLTLLANSKALASDQNNAIGARAHQQAIIEQSLLLTPTPPWPPKDEFGMANTQGAGTWMRCAFHLNQAGAKVYELGHVRSNTMPSSPWAAPMQYQYPPTEGAPGAIVVWHTGTELTGTAGAQGTQMDAFGHWGFLPEKWNGKGAIPRQSAQYYGGHSQAEVKPDQNGPLHKLGIDKAVPIITSAVLLDAKNYLGKGQAMQPGEQIHAADIEAMLKAQKLDWRGILPGDVVYIYTGWGDNWNEKHYYQGGPGLSLDGAKYLANKQVALVALDNPFTDAINIGQLTGEAEPPPGSPAEMFAPVHFYNLTQAGIHNIQNAKLTQMAADKVWTSCTVILPIKVKGASGAPVNPIAIGSTHH